MPVLFRVGPEVVTGAGSALNTQALSDEGRIKFVRPVDDMAETFIVGVISLYPPRSAERLTT